MLKAQSNIKKINEARQSDGIEEKGNKEDDDPQLLGEAKTAMKDVGWAIMKIRVNDYCLCKYHDYCDYWLPYICM